MQLLTLLGLLFKNVIKKDSAGNNKRLNSNCIQY